MSTTTSAFASLLANPGADSPAIVQKNAERRFGQQVSRSGLHRREPSEPVPAGLYVVIGIATYSPLELALLDDLDFRSPSWANGLRIDVFSVLECQSIDEVRKYLPGITQELRQTPIVGVWNDRELTACAIGLRESQDLLGRVGVSVPDSVRTTNELVPTEATIMVYRGHVANGI